MRGYRMIVVAIVGLVVVGAGASAGAWTPPRDDGAFIAQLDEAVALTRAGELDEAIRAWDDFAFGVDVALAAGHEVGEVFVVARFQVDLEIARLIDTITPLIDAGPARLAHLARSRWHLDAYLERFEPGAVPWMSDARPGVTADDRDEATYRLARALIGCGAEYAALGDESAAIASTADGRVVLARVIDAEEPSSPWYPAMSSLYLTATLTADGPGAFVRETERVLERWPHADPRDPDAPPTDHRVLSQVRRQAAAWASELSELPPEERPGRAALIQSACQMVRRAHHEWFHDVFANRTDNVWAHLVDARVSIMLGDIDRARSLLDALAALDGVPTVERDSAARIGVVLDHATADARARRDLLAFVDRLLEHAGQGAVAESTPLPPDRPRRAERPPPRPSLPRTPTDLAMPRHRVLPVAALGYRYATPVAIALVLALMLGWRLLHRLSTGATDHERSE
ncbi:MAG: hypothetical protein GY715_21620 [Planctomycetes bacterium]|nr:hypothetical protein [Planctomycetota bacterium]